MSKSRYRVPALTALLALVLSLFLLALRGLRGLREEGGAERPRLLSWREAEDADLFGGAER